MLSGVGLNKEGQRTGSARSGRNRALSGGARPFKKKGDKRLRSNMKEIKHLLEGYNCVGKGSEQGQDHSPKKKREKSGDEASSRKSKQMV